MAEEPKGENTPASSSNANKITDSNPDANNLGDPSVLEPSAEQAEWERLKGSSQDRFSDMFKRARTAEVEKAQLEQQLQQAQGDLSRVSQVPQSNQQFTDPRREEVDRAVKTLKDERFTQDEDVEKIVNERLNQVARTLQLDREHERLERENRSFRRKHPEFPVYDREQVEDYGRRHNIFNPEAAFHELYRDEYLDLGLSDVPKKPPVTDKPSAAASGSHEEPMDITKLREKLSGPKGTEWYRQQMKDNPEEFKQMVAQLTQG